MTGPVVQSHGPEGVIVDEKVLSDLESTYELVYGKDHWRAPATQEMRREVLAKAVLMLVREVRSLKAQLEAKKKAE